MPKIGVRALNALLFALCCFEAAQIVTRVTGHGLQDGAVATAPGAEAAAAQAPAPPDDSSIVARNLFGAQLGNDTLPPAPEEHVEETKLPLTLLATIAPDPRTAGAGEPKVARAAIYDGTSKESLVVVPGDALGTHQDVFVSRIERGRVLLRNQGRSEELLLAEEADVPTGLRPAPPPAAAGRNFSRRPARPRPPARSVRPRSTNRAVNRAVARPRVAPRPVVPPPATPPDIDPEDAARLQELRDKVTRGEMSIGDLANEMQQMQNQDDQGADDADPGQPDDPALPDDQSEY